MRVSFCSIVAAIVSALILNPNAAAQTTIAADVIGAGATEATGGSFALKGTVGQPAIGIVTGGSFQTKQGFWYAQQSLSTVLVLANLKVFLEGPFSAGSMSTALNPNVPLAQPYSDAFYAGRAIFYGGTESVGAMPGNVVDWVEVELRTGTAATDSVSTRAGLLLSSGVITDIDGSSQLAFDGVTPGNYYAVVRHRNHLPVMTASAIALSGTASALYDFSTAANKAFGSNAQKDLGGGVFGVYAGDANATNQIGNDDKNEVWALETGGAGYLKSDFNMDGQSQVSDKNDLWNVNVGLTSQFPD